MQIPQYCLLCSYPNLGEIGGMLQRDSVGPTAADAQAMIEGPSRPYAPDGPHLDAPAAFGSLTLLALMLALSFGRVLGLDQWMSRAVRKYKEQRREGERWRVIEARQRLEQQFEDDL